MRKYITTALLVGALNVVPVVALAAQTSAATKHTKHASTSTAATHATRGIITSLDETTLVISRSGKKPAEMTFMLNPSTQREGNLAVGTPVSVRYREDGKTHVATALSAQPKQQSHAAKK